MFEKTYFSFVVIYQKSYDIVYFDHALNLRLFVGGQNYQVQIAFVDGDDGVWNFWRDI
jgi:hypothetical protein